MRNQSIQKFDQSIADGALETINAYGRFLTIVSIVGNGSLDVALPGETFVALDPQISYGLPQDRAFDHIRLRNESGASIAYKLYLSEQPMEINMAGIQATLADILEALTGAGSTLAYIPQATVGTTAVKILDAASKPRDIVLNQEYPGGSNYVWYGIDNTVTSSKWIAQTMPGGSMKIEGHTGEIWAIAGAASEYVGGYTK